MSKIIFQNGKECNIDKARKTEHTLKLFGQDVPQETCGFQLIRDWSNTPLNYADYTTVYMVEDDGVTFSNDGSKVSYTTKISVSWNDSDNYDEVRPESVEVTVSKNGEELEVVALSADDNWSKEYIDYVEKAVYTVDAADVENYEKTISGLVVSFSHEANIPVPEPVATAEEKLEAQVFYTAVMTDTLLEEEE